MVYVSYIVETEAVNANNKNKYNYAVSSNVNVRGDSSPCSRGIWSYVSMATIAVYFP